MSAAVDFPPTPAECGTACGPCSAKVVPLPVAAEALAPSTPKPAVGRVAHYVSYGTPGGEYTSQCRAATITEVDNELMVDFYRGPDAVPNVGLAVVNPTGLFFHPLADGGGVAHDAGVTHDPDADRDGGRTGPMCTGLAHRPGSWHFPART